jgi:pyruvate/2-oxoglutarate dehydrogenase complex dihydrolipoamide acyltransferase (E2) component
MSSEIRIPQLGASMLEGTLLEWHVADGAAVAKGDILYVLESEKAAEEIESPASGTLRILAAANASYPVGELIGRIDD